MNNLINRNILVTGSNKGIGKELAIGLGSQGANIILLGRNSTGLEEVYDEIQKSKNTSPLIIECDLENLDEKQGNEINNLILESYGHLDAVINNASIIGKMSSLSDYDLKTWNSVLNVNLTASFLLTKSLLPALSGSKIPRIIFTSSGVALTGRAFWGAYAISKAATKSMAEIFKEELEGTSNIKVFNFDPGATRTSMRAFAYPAEDPSKLKEPSELLKCYEWLLSDESKDANDLYFTFNSFD
jgi:NAD(P)-dependent dehydrogenase (short-subunit alcohol dehydrogenase family)